MGVEDLICPPGKDGSPPSLATQGGPGVVEVLEELVWESRTLFALLAKTDLLLIQSLKGTRTTRTFVRDSLDRSGCVHVFYPYHG